MPESGGWVEWQRGWRLRDESGPAAVAEYGAFRAGEAVFTASGVIDCPKNFAIRANG